MAGNSNGTKVILGVAVGILALILIISGMATARASEAKDLSQENLVLITRLEGRLKNIEEQLVEIKGDVKVLVRRREVVKHGGLEGM